MNSKKFNVLLNSKIGSFNKTIQVDADKSLSIRSFLIGSISEKISTTKKIENCRFGKGNIIFAKLTNQKCVNFKIKRDAIYMFYTYIMIKTFCTFY